MAPPLLVCGLAHTRTWSANAGDYDRYGAQEVLIN